MAPSRARRVKAYVDKMRAEVRALNEAGVETTGNAFSSVLFVKGEPGEAERDGRGLLAGADGKALKASLLALGYAPEDWAALAAWGADEQVLPAELLRRAVVALDPATLVILDDAAAQAVREAFVDDLAAIEDLNEALLVPGYVVRVAGMRTLNLGGFEAALADDHEKQRMWAYLKQLTPLGEPY